jgi:hypothetical protein
MVGSSKLRRLSSERRNVSSIIFGRLFGVIDRRFSAAHFQKNLAFYRPREANETVTESEYDVNQSIPKEKQHLSAPAQERDYPGHRQTPQGVRRVRVGEPQDEVSGP